MSEQKRLVLMNIIDFDTIVSSNTFEPVSSEVKVYPFLDIGERIEPDARWHADGGFVIDGLFASGSTLVRGYHVWSPERLSWDSETEAMLDVLDISVKRDLETKFPSLSVSIGSVRRTEHLKENWNSLDKMLWRWRAGEKNNG